MTAYINKIKSKAGDQQLPVTHERAVRDDNGTTLESKLQNLEGAMDKAYVASSDNGMGRITLKKNMVSGVNTLTQSMMQATNTIYVIQYDFTLGEDVTIPANCVLEFDGGSISGAYSLINVGKIINVSGSVIFKSVTFVNPLKQYVQLRWFDYNSVGDSLMAAAKFQIVDAVGTWNIDKDVVINNDIELFGGTFNCRNGYEIYNFKIASSDVSEVLQYNSTIAKQATSINIGINGNYKYCLLQASNYYFKNNERNGIVGEMMTIESLTQQATNFGMCKTVCSYESDVTVKYFNTISANIYNCRFLANYNETEKEGTLLSLSYCTGIIRDCYFTGCSIGLSINNSYNVDVSSCRFENIYPWAVIFSGATFNSTVRGCMFNKHRHAWTTLGEAYVAKFNTICNCNISKSFIPITSHANAYGTMIEGNHISDCNGGVGSYSPNCTCIGNLIENGTDGTASAIYYIEAGPINPVIKNNVIINKRGYGDGIQIDSDLSSATFNTQADQDVLIIGNTIDNVTSGNGIYCNSIGSSGRITIENNEIVAFGYTGITAYGKEITVRNNNIQRAQRGNSGIIVGLRADYIYANSLAIIQGNFMYFTGRGTNPAIETKGLESTFICNNIIEGSNELYKKTGNGSVTGDVKTFVPSTPTRGDMVFVNGRPQWYDITNSRWVYADGNPVV